MLKKSSSSVHIFYPKWKKEEVIEIIKNDLENAKRELSLLLVVLFGSYAKGNYTVASDIDLLVVYQGQERKDAYAVVKKAIRLPNLEPHVYTEEEYKKMKGTVEMMTRKGVVIFSSPYFNGHTYG